MEIIIKKSIWFFVLIILSTTGSLFAQQSVLIEKTEFDIQMKKMTEAIAGLKKSNRELKNSILEQKNKIDTLRKLLDTKEEIIKKNIETAKEDTGRQILGINKTISIRSLIWVIFGIVILLLGVIVYFVLKKKLSLNKRTLEEQISKTREGLEAEAMKLDSKLMEILETQLRIFKEKAQETQDTEKEIDHSLALRVGEEIHRMRKRIENMPADVKGLGALKNSLMRLEEEFNENGYEIIDLLGQPWNDGLTVSARFIPSDDLKPGEEIITKIIKPQINYKGVLIKAGEIEVSTGG